MNSEAKKGPAMTCKDVQAWVSETLDLEPAEAYSERTIAKWLHLLGLVKGKPYVAARKMQRERERERERERKIHTHTHTHTFLFSFNVNDTRKGIYMDGHERPDVILSRGKFSDLFHYWRERSVKFDDETLEATNLDAKYIMASLDQKAHHSNDIIKR